VPKENELDYEDVCPELVFEDFFGRFAPGVGFSVISDSNHEFAKED